jgi:hypothetical protein
MEVPHHTHPQRKKRTHYFWEFFMLFLAVSAGFFVENQREHFIENKREKQFIKSLINDVEADTARLNTIIKNRIAREQRLDSFTMMMNSSSRNNFTGDIYFYAAAVTRTNTIRFIPNDGTMQQLKNSGALRLIRSAVIVDSIAKYDVSTRFLLRQGEIEETLIVDYRQAAPKLFDALIFEKMLDEDNNVSKLTGENPPLLPFSKSDLDTWNYRMFSIKGLNKAIRRDARLFLQQAVNFLNTLKKGYHPE